jgi:hypothetical protein
MTAVSMQLSIVSGAQPELSQRTIQDCSRGGRPAIPLIANPRKVLLKSIEPFPAATDSISKGNLLPVYRRADLSRTIKLVVALALAAASTGAFAREFRAADTQNEDYPTVQALGYMGSLVSERSGGRHQI